MKEVKIQIPDNCELVKDGDSYVVREKRQNPPRSWEEFCERYPVREGEMYIDSHSSISSWPQSDKRHEISGKNWCISREESEAFLALMQLRQLRKAWVGDWKPDKHVEFSIIVYNINYRAVIFDAGHWAFNYSLTFPTPEMADDFLGCFRDLCETAKILL